jgi:hypothetical protein
MSGLLDWWSVENNKQESLTHYLKTPILQKFNPPIIQCSSNPERFICGTIQTK